MNNIYSALVRSLPFTYGLLFLLTTVITVFLIYRSIGPEKNYKKYALYFLGAWILILSLVSIEGAYSDFEAFPPRLFIM